MSFLLQQCLGCLVRLTGMVRKMGSRWPYSSLPYFVIIAKSFLHLKKYDETFSNETLRRCTNNFLCQISSSSSSCRASSTDIPDPLTPPLPIVHRFWQVLRATSRILSKLLYVGSSWSPCFFSPMWRSTSLMSSSLLLQLCPARLVRLTLTVFVMGGRWPYCYCFVGCCLQDLFSIARSILV